jgi:hypothetical protein
MRSPVIARYRLANGTLDQALTAAAERKRREVRGEAICRLRPVSGQRSSGALNRGIAIYANVPARAGILIWITAGLDA